MPKERRHYEMPASQRDKIAQSKTLQLLIDHVEGKSEMSQSRVTAGLALLKKVMPDLANVQVEGNPDRPLAVSTIQLVAPALDNGSD